MFFVALAKVVGQPIIDDRRLTDAVGQDFFRQRCPNSELACPTACLFAVPCGVERSKGLDMAGRAVFSSLLVALGLSALWGCGADITVEGAQEGLKPGEPGVGVMMSAGSAFPGVDMPEVGIAADDMLFFVRSFEPEDCSQGETFDFGEGRTGFHWQVFFLLPAKRLVAGETFSIGESSFGQEDAAMSALSSELGGTDGWTGGEGRACEDARYDPVTPVTGRILEVGDESITVRFDSLCFDNEGPWVEILDENGDVLDWYDDPDDDVVIDASGTYVLSRCDAPG